MDEERDKYRQRRAKDVEIEQRMLDAVAEVIEGTAWDDPEGILTDVLIVMTSRDIDGDYNICWINAGPDTAAEGMAMRVIRDITMIDQRRLRNSE